MSAPQRALPLGLLVARPCLPPAGGCPSAPGFDWDQLAPLYQPQAPGRQVPSPHRRPVSRFVDLETETHGLPGPALLLILGSEQRTEKAGGRKDAQGLP
jgi:hypothetical protein